MLLQATTEQNTCQGRPLVLGQSGTRGRSLVEESPAIGMHRADYSTETPMDDRTLLVARLRRAGAGTGA